MTLCIGMNSELNLLYNANYHLALGTDVIHTIIVSARLVLVPLVGANIFVHYVMHSRNFAELRYYAHQSHVHLNYKNGTSHGNEN